MKTLTSLVLFFSIITSTWARVPELNQIVSKAAAIHPDGRIPVVVIDISQDGCRVDTSAMLRISEKVQLEVPKYGTFAAQIRWALGNEAGAVFLEPVFVD